MLQQIYEWFSVFTITDWIEFILAILVFLFFIIVISLSIPDTIYKPTGNTYKVKIIEKIYRPSGYNVSEAYILIFTSKEISGKCLIDVEQYGKLNVNDIIEIEKFISKAKTIKYEIFTN